MPVEKKPYEIEFIYTDNDQPFRTTAILDDDEVETLRDVLDRYDEAGAIDNTDVYISTPVTQDFDSVVNEIASALKDEVPDADHISLCQNCERVWPDAVLITPIPDLEQRVAPGEIMPSGECPVCGAVCHIVKE